MTLSLSGGAVADSATDQNLRKIAQLFPLQPENIAGGVRNFGIVSSLPTEPTPVAGDLCTYIADKTNGVLWALMYDGEGELKWKFTGGPPLYAEITTSEGTTSETFVALATAGPQITVPLKGDYDVTIGTRVLNNTNGGSSLMSYSIGGSAAVTADAIDHAAGTAGANVTNHEQRMRRKTALAASTALVAKYRRAAAGTATFASRWMSVVPVRVG